MELVKISLGTRVKAAAIGIIAILSIALISSPVSYAQETSRPTAATASRSSGWFSIPNTDLKSKCPDVAQIQATEGCSAVLADWNSGLADTKRNRLVLWGSGHNGYFGNEMYALDLEKQSLERITEPSSGEALANLKECPEAYADGKPNARHTYNGLQYVAKQDLYFVFGAGLSPCGNFSNVVWLFDPAQMRWMRKSPKNHPNPGQNGSIPMTAYDSAAGMLYEVEGNVGVFWRYDPSGDNWTNLGEVKACSKLNMTAAIDPQRKLYFCVGNGAFQRIGLSNHKVSDLKGRGCDGLVTAGGPGFDYDSSQRRMVGWAGGGTVYIYDEETDSCSTKSFAGDPGPEEPNGTFGRFRYFPALSEFALVNGWKQNAYVLRLGSD
jgi:hypothetical protein